MVSAKCMWKVIITEIQDANMLDPMNAPAGAFFVSTERFARTVDYLDLPTGLCCVYLEDGRHRAQNISRQRQHKSD